MNSQQLINISLLESMMGLSVQAISNLCDQGFFPMPITLPDGDLAWKDSDIRASLEALAAAVSWINKNNGKA